MRSRYGSEALRRTPFVELHAVRESILRPLSSTAIISGVASRSSRTTLTSSCPAPISKVKNVRVRSSLVSSEIVAKDTENLFRTVGSKLTSINRLRRQGLAHFAFALAIDLTARLKSSRW